MAVLVPTLTDCRSQLNEVATSRDKASDGWIGDWAHSQGNSDHNPDDTGKNNAGWDGDPDSTEEVRAIDIDKDFRAEFTPNQFLNHLLKYCRNGTFWWIRYIIFDGYIYHKYVNNYEKRIYTGANDHSEHFHISSDWSQSADNYTNANYRFEELLPMALDATDKQFIKDELAKLVTTVAFSTGGGQHAPVGDGVLNSSWPLTAGATRTLTWANLQQMYAKLVAIEAKVDALQVAMPGPIGADIAGIKSMLNELTADPAETGFSHPIVAAVEFAENNEPS